MFDFYTIYVGTGRLTIRMVRQPQMKRHGHLLVIRILINAKSIGYDRQSRMFRSKHPQTRRREAAYIVGPYRVLPMRAIKSMILLLVFCRSSARLFGQGKPLPQPPKDSISIKVDSLKAVIIFAPVRPHLKGDTLEYNTANFQMRPNDMVESLLRRLPGLQIDGNGQISYNGEKIDHLLVDGEDIFGNDPTVVTRNFDASKIARVQLLDRKSDQTLFSGVDDGTRIKTLNLVMKESAKHGYFGQVEAGANATGNYSGNGALIGVRDKEQLVVLGMASNTGATDITSNAGGTSARIGFISGFTDPLGTSAGVGIPRFEGIGMHYSNAWNGTGDHLTGNYQYSHNYTQPTAITQILQTVPGSVYGQYQKSQSVNEQGQHWGQAIYDAATGTASSVRLFLRAGNSQGQNQYGASNTSSTGDTLVNGSEIGIRDHLDEWFYGADAAWRLQIGQSPKRIFSVSASLVTSDEQTNGYLYSLNRFYQPNGMVLHTDTVDQRKTISTRTANWSGSLAYTQPLWKDALLEMRYVLHRVESNPSQTSFNRDGGKYDAVVDSLTSHFQSVATDQNATLTLDGKRGQWNYLLTGSAIVYDYHQQNLLKDSLLRQHNITISPGLLISWKPTPESEVKFNYTTFTLEPDISQLAPTVNNSDPLHITVGNPLLKPGFIQSFKLDFIRIKTWLFNLRLGMNVVDNSISSKTTTDSLGRQVTEPENVSGGSTGVVNLSFGRKLLGVDLALHLSTNYMRTYSYVDAELSRSDVYISAGGFSLQQYLPDKYSFQLNTMFSYLHQLSTINPGAPEHYWTQSHEAKVALFLLPQIEVGSIATYTWQEKTSTFTGATTVFLLNSYIARDFLRNKLTVRFQLNNILNRNAGIVRTNLSNVNTQNTVNVMGRYALFSVIYHFDKKFAHK